MVPSLKHGQWGQSVNQLTERQQFVWSHFFTDKGFRTSEVNVDSLDFDEQAQEFLDSCRRMRNRFPDALGRVEENVKRAFLQESLRPDTEQKVILQTIADNLAQPFPEKHWNEISYSLRGWKWDYKGVEKTRSIYYRVAWSIAYYSRNFEYRKYGIEGKGATAAEQIQNIMTECEEDFDAIRDWLAERGYTNE